MVTKAKKTSRRRGTAREATVRYESNGQATRGIIREIPAGKFKAKCLAIMDEVQQRGGAYIITKRGLPVAKLVPVRVDRRRLLEA